MKYDFNTGHALLLLVRPLSRRRRFSFILRPNFRPPKIR